ncbi:MAG TPA: protein kinase, partial [Candidatus Eisenbacteria bacterium]|nr:protein kinase [Candidatus Eisenbacteria bacterium]
EREARLLASLSHPNIAGIFGLEEANGSRYLVLELVEGESLAERLGRGALPLDEALDVARQIATGLEAAHESGVVHRDLKPGNVMLTPSGGVKVLDFGLAKSDADDRPASGANLASSPTLTHSPTVAGVILGTAAYMSPEQARGKPVDKRSDIWSFGCVLYECLTGKPLFDGETVSDLIAQILQTEPDLAALPSATPAGVRALLRRCLTKDHRTRLRDIGEARIALAAAASGATAAGDAPAAGDARNSRGGYPWWAALLALSLVSAISVFAALRFGAPSKTAPLRKLDLVATDMDHDWFVAPTLSPNGRQFAYTGKGKILVRDLDALATRTVADISEGTPLAWSPDSRMLIYRDRGTLYKVSAQGGEPTALCKIPGTGAIIGAAWGRSGKIAFSVWRGGMYQVGEGGGDPKLYIDIDPATTIDYHYPSWLSNGDLLYVTHWKQDRDSAGHVQPLVTIFDGKRPIALHADLGDGDVAPQVTTTGELLFLRSGTGAGIWALAFDAARRRVSGEPFLVAPGAVSISLSDDGSLLYLGGENRDAASEMVWLDRSGKTLETLTPTHPGLEAPSISPDGRRITFVAATNGNQDIWVRDLLRGAETRLTFGGANELAPRWFPSSSRIVYIERAGVAGRYMAVNADGSGGQLEVAPRADLGGTAGKPSPLDIAPDAKSAIRITNTGGHSHLRVGPLDAGGVLGSLSPLIQGQPEPDVGQGAISPDGRLLAYVTDDPGKNDLFLTRYPSGAGKWQVGTDGGREPRWSAKTGELFFLGGSGPGNRWLAAASVNPAQEPPLESVTKLFDLGPLTSISDYDFDVSPDGRRFLFTHITGSAAGVPRRLVLVENWRSEFSKKRGL